MVGCEDFRDRFSYWLDRAATGEELLLTCRGRPRARLTQPTQFLPALRTPRIPP